MANIKANIKTKRKSDKKSVANKSQIAANKTQIKKAVKTKDAKDLNKVYKNTDSLASKGIIHKNKASRIKSRTAKKVNKK